MAVPGARPPARVGREDVMGLLGAESRGGAGGKHGEGAELFPRAWPPSC